VKRTVIITSPAGQLGNRLLQMCSFIAFAKENDLNLLNPGFDKYDYARYFDFTDKNILCQYPPAHSQAKNIKEKRKRKFGLYRFITEKPVLKRVFYTEGRIHKRPGIVPSSLSVYLLLGTNDSCNLDEPNEPLLREIGNAKNIFVGGWMFRAVKSFDKHADEFRSLFTPKEKHLENVRSVITRARSQCEVLVGVHIRHGDYKDHFGGIYYYETAVYKEKMEQVKALFPGKSVKFLVCSNGQITDADFAGLDVAFGLGEQLEDMYSFAYCDHIIGPPSTFTGWASFWGKKPLCFIDSRERKISKEDFFIFNSERFLQLDETFVKLAK
jgi:hypothetical protein